MRCLLVVPAHVRVRCATWTQGACQSPGGYGKVRGSACKWLTALVVLCDVAHAAARHRRADASGAAGAAIDPESALAARGASAVARLLQPNRRVTIGASAIAHTRCTSARISASLAPAW